MEHNSDIDTPGAWSAVIIVGAMLIGALASEVLDGLIQAVVLAVCLATMGGGVIADLMRRLSLKKSKPAHFAKLDFEPIEIAFARGTDINQQALEILRPVERATQPVTSRL
jgi:hypothetical protein